MDYQGRNFAIWPPYEAFYIQSMLFNARSAMRSVEFLAELMQKVTEQDIVKPIRDVGFSVVLDRVQNIVLHGGSLSRFLWPVSTCRERGDYLITCLEVSESSPLKSRKLRNSIEHFDERLDNYFKKNIAGTIFPEYVGTTPKSDGVPVHFFRAYFIDTGSFFLLGEEYNIPEIVKEISRIHTLLESSDRSGGRLRIEPQQE